MKKLAVLGPSGSYCDIAAKKYLEENNLELEIEYYPNIIKTALAIDSNTIAILPFENTLDGFVLEALDIIIAKDYNISSQLKLNIDFAFVSNNKDISKIKNVYCQFKAYGQCLEFIMKNNFNILRTQSNSETVELINSADDTFGAIIPVHSLKDNHYNLKILHVADSTHNETRFLIVNNNKDNQELSEKLEASIVITTVVDRPGILYEILKKFHDLNLNLKSILSRPMKTEMGRYKFYMECSLTKDELNLLEELEKSIKDEYIVNVLGVYNTI